MLPPVYFLCGSIRFHPWPIFLLKTTVVKKESLKGFQELAMTESYT
ncbi:MAG: hypothetical protein Q8N47_09120 [Bryobacterales bacterium]|nr:hypothetical protein [Bryobacterales bacterium]